jgi:hypothetical protein
VYNSFTATIGGGWYVSEERACHDEPSRARGCFEVWQLRHGSYDDFAFAAIVQALRLRGPRLGLRLRGSIAPRSDTHLRLRIDPAGASLHLYLPECVVGAFCELRLGGVLRLSQRVLRFSRHSAPFRGSEIVPTSYPSFPESRKGA